MRKFYLGISIIILVGLVIIYNYLPTLKEGLIPGVIAIPKDSSGKYLPIPSGHMRINDSEMAPIPDGYTISQSGVLIPTSENSAYIARSSNYGDNTIQGTIDIPKDGTGKLVSIPDKFMQINSVQMAPIPYGYTLSSDKMRLVPTPGLAPYNEMLLRGQVPIPKDSNGIKLPIPTNFIKIDETTMARIPGNISLAEYANTISSSVSGYNANNLNPDYTNSVNRGSGQINRKSDQQNPLSIQGTVGSGQGSYQQSPWADNSNWGLSQVRSNYNPAYVPTYEDSVYFSTIDDKTIIVPENGTQIISPEIAGGFCSAYASLPSKLEEACNKIDNNSCGSTSCCVLVGGTRCMAGNETGPTNKAIYSDLTLLNKDYYYYQGKCYGNCNK